MKEPTEVLDGADINQDIHQLVGYVWTLGNTEKVFPTKHCSELCSYFLFKYGERMRRDRALDIADTVSDKLLGGERGWESLTDEQFKNFLQRVRKLRWKMAYHKFSVTMYSDTDEEKVSPVEVRRNLSRVFPDFEIDVYEEIGGVRAGIKRKDGTVDYENVPTSFKKLNGKSSHPVLRNYPDDDIPF